MILADTPIAWLHPTELTEMTTPRYLLRTTRPTIATSYAYVTQLTVTRTGLGAGTVAGGAITCGATCSASFATPASVTLTAQAGAESVFAGWSGACAGTGPCTVTMNAARAATARFDLTGATVAASDTDVSLDTPAGRLDFTPHGLSAAGAVDATVSCATPADPPVEYRFVPGCVFDVHAHGALAFASADVCLPYDAAAVSGAGLVPAVLEMATRESGDAWTRLDSQLAADGRTVCTRVTQLGTFALLAAERFGRYFAEGATSGFFDMRVALLNPTTRASETILNFDLPGGAVTWRTVQVPPLTRVTVDPKILPGLATAEFSTHADSNGVLVLDRTMSWDTATGYGAHAETSVLTPAVTWYLAEGATHSGFDLFYLLQNPTPQAAEVRVRFLRPSGAPLEKTYTLVPYSRTNIWVDVEPFEGLGAALANADVSAIIESTNRVPIIVERAMYLTQPGQFFAAGHESAGVTAPATRWFLAEGATGPFFDLFVLIANPMDTAADCALRNFNATNRFSRTSSAR